MKYLCTLLLFFTTFLANAQGIAMADEMRENGKIYVVVAVLLVILIGLFIYLFSIDRKVKRLENKFKDKV